MTGANAWWQSIEQVNATPPVPYQGPGDIVSGAKTWWGLRCYNTAYTGNVADVYAPSDASHTLLTCSSGGIINETLQPLATTCATSCTVKTLYDQSGASTCTGAVACNLTQATEASRPTFTQSCLGSLPCMTFSGTQNLPAVATFSQAQTFTISWVCERTAAFTTAQDCVGDSATGIVQAGFQSVAGRVWMFAGTVVAGVTLTDSTWFAVQAIYAGASSDLNVNGTSNAKSPGTNGFSTRTLVVGGGNNNLQGRMVEGGIWSGGFSAGNETAMSANQRGYWGF